MTKEEVESLNVRFKEFVWYKGYIDYKYPNMSEEDRKNLFITGVMLELAKEVQDKLAERDTTLTLTYEVDDTKEDDEVTNETLPVSAHLKLDLVKFAHVVSGYSKEPEKLLEISKKLYEWISK